MTAQIRFEKSGQRLWLQQLGALINKEFEQIWRDPSSWMVAGVLPLIFLLLFGYGISLDAGILRVSILSAGAGEDGQDIAASFAHSPWFISNAPLEEKTAEIMLRNSQSQGFITFRPNFASRETAGKSGSLELIIDGSEPNTARFIEMYSRRLISDWQSRRNPGGQTEQSLITLRDRYWFNPDTRSRYFLVPGSITVIMTLIGTLLTSLVFAREWERGTIEVLFTTPVSRMQILLGKLIPYFCLGMIAMALCVFLAINLFHTPFRGSFSALFILSSIFMLGALGQGLFISICLKKQLIAAQAGLYSGFLPALLLSGFVFDIQSMPWILQCLTKLLPATWFNICIRTIFLAGDIWALFLPCMLAMGSIALVLLGAVYIKLVKRLN